MHARSNCKSIVAILIITILIDYTFGDPQPDNQNVKFTCDENGVKLIKATQNPTYKQLQILSNAENKDYCLSKPMNAEIDVSEQTSACHHLSSRKTVDIMVETEVDPNVVGGKTVKFFTLKCEEGSYRDTFTAIPFPIVNPTGSMQTIKNTIHQTITFKITKDDDRPLDKVTIGDPLKLVMTGSNAKTIISPIQCTATPQDQETPKHKMIWSNSTHCNRDTAIISKSKWEGTQPNIYLRFYAFRFLSSPDVRITCEANICLTPDLTDCHLTCGPGQPNIRGRRSSDIISKKGKEVKTFSVYYSVETGNEKSNSSSGIGVNRFMCLVLVLLASKRWFV